jgi:hypothetical protein
MKSKIVLVLSLLLIFSIHSFAAVKKPNPSFTQVLTTRFTKQWASLFQEKVYLHTDKPYYSAGEKIWFKAYLVNATTNEPSEKSNYVYVELIDQLDSVKYRVKLHKDSLGFQGHMTLKPETSAGKYQLRAYTYWMQNAGIDFFFSKTIFVGNKIDDRITSTISYGALKDGFVPVFLHFTDVSRSPIAGKKVEIAENWASGSKRKHIYTTGKEGEISWNINVASEDSSMKSVGVAIPDKKYQTNFFLPEFKTDYDIQFFPQSGTFLNNSLQTIGFKAIGKDGLSVEVSGKVFSDKNEELCDFTTLHHGMGKFTIQTQPGETYHALVKSKDGLEKRLELPKTQDSGAVIHLLYNRGRILYEVTNNTGLPDHELYLMMHSRGKLVVLQSLKNLNGQIVESDLPSGMASLAVIDTLGNTYCERLTFVRNFDFPKISMQSDKPVYGKRALVQLDFKISSLHSLPVNGDFSLSVTDSHTVVRDSLTDNIVSNLLLCSDIRGNVEDPASYFMDDKMNTREKMDVLLLTQGWRRFNTSDVVKGIYKQPKYYLERGQALSGKVLNLFNAPSKKCDIMMISPYKSMVKLVQTDSLGRYLIDGIEFPDSTCFVLKAKKPKSLTDVEIIPDTDVFPESSVNIPSSSKGVLEVVENEYLTISKEKYYFEGGMRAVNLDEVTVTTDKKASERNDYYSGMADAEITAEQLEKNPSISIINLLYTIPGIQISGDQISIRGASGNPLILLDNMEMDNVEELSYLQPMDLESIQVFKGANKAIFGARGGNGVIAIKLKIGANVKSPTPISLARVIPLGYQKPAEFYVPKYELDSVYASSNPDFRTTIYWNPGLRCDTNGVIHTKFYTADKEFNYSIVVEGLTNAGELCRYEGVLKRRNE